MLRTKNMVSKPLVRLIRRTIKGVIMLLGLIVGLQTVHVDVGGLITGLGIGGIGIAFAAKDTISHMFGSLVIFLDRPFQIGDWVIIDKVEGYVEDVGFRTTRVRTFYNSLVYIPNAKLVDTNIDNMELRIYRRFRTFLKIHLHTPEPLLQAYVEGLRAITAAHPMTRKDAYLIYVTDFHEYSIEITFWIFLAARSFIEELTARQEVILQMISLARRLGIEFAYPTRTVHIDSQFPHEGHRQAAHEREWTEDELRAVVKAYGPGGKHANERFALTHGYFPSQASRRRDTTEV
jgi:MscS family membrane protein